MVYEKRSQPWNPDMVSNMSSQFYIENWVFDQKNQDV